jgi:hypothetical protein
MKILIASVILLYVVLIIFIVKQREKNQYLLNKYENIFDSVLSNSKIISKCILAEREIVDTMQKMAKTQNEFTKFFGKLVENQDKMTNALRSVTEKVVKLEKE